MNHRYLLYISLCVHLHTTLANPVPYFCTVKNLFDEARRVMQKKYYQINPVPLPKKILTPAEIAAQLPPHFLLGVSTSAHQYGPQCVIHPEFGHDICDVARWSNEHHLKQPIPKDGYTLNINTHWEAYIDTAAQLGFTVMRIEVSWPLIQPDGPESYNQEALELYSNIFNYMLSRGITPLVCFFHYHHPCWFLDHGGFTRSSNKRYFAAFSATTYKYLMEKAEQDNAVRSTFNTITPLWATFNSPEAIGFKQFMTGDLPQPPHDRSQKKLQLALETFKNICEAHVDAAEAIHHVYARSAQIRTAGIPVPRIGVLKNIHQLDPSPDITNYSEKIKTNLFCLIGNMIQNDGIFNFFTTGVFCIALPGQCFVTSSKAYTAERVKKSLQWIGLNYYSNRFQKGSKAVPEKNPEYQTASKNYRIYPQGMYRALLELNDRCAKILGIPILVTENGLSCPYNDATWNAKRNKFYAEYLYMIEQAIAQGCRVIGYLTWSLADNFEWQSPESDGIYHANTVTYDRRYYGLCAVDSNGNITLKDPNNFLVQVALYKKQQ